MSDLRVTVSAELDKNSIKTVEQELAQAGGILGGGHGADKKSPLTSQIEAMGRLAGILKDIQDAMSSSTKAISQQVALREKELTLLKEGNKLGNKPPGWAPESGQPVEEEDGNKRRYAWRGTHNWARGISGAHALMNSGGSNAGIAQAIGTATGMVLPELKPIIDASTAIFTDAFHKQENFREQALRRYQVGGSSGLDIDEGSLYGTSMDNIRKGLGFGIGQFSSMYTRGAKGGVFDQNATPQATMVDLMRGEASMGVGNEMSGLLGAARRQGASNSDTEIIGNAIGLAVSEHMSKGRIGEIFTQLTREVESNTKAQTDIGDTANRLLFISSLGAQYKGDTGAARDMDQSLKSLAGGNTAFTQYSMLKAAGMGEVGYSEAWLKSQRGLGTKGGIGYEDLITANFGDSVTRYAGATSDAERAAVVHTISSMTGMNGGQVEDILKGLVKDGKFKRINAASGYQNFDSLSTTPDKLLAPRREKAVGEDIWRFGIGDTTKRRGYASDTEPYTTTDPANDQSQPKPSSIDGPNASNGTRNGTAFRSKLEAYAQEHNIPVSFLENWIKMESGGRNSTTTRYNERGFFQIMGGYDAKHPFKGSQADMLGMSEQEHKNISTDEDASLKWGVKSVAFLRKQAEKARDRYGLQWNDQDMWRLTKMEHGGSGNVNSALERATKQLGHAPRNWSEMSQAAAPTAGAQERNVLNNANKMVVEVVVSDRRVSANVTQRSGSSNAPGQTTVRR